MPQVVDVDATHDRALDRMRSCGQAESAPGSLPAVVTPRRVYWLIAPLCLEKQVLAARHPPFFAASAIANVKRHGHQVLVRDLYRVIAPLSTVVDEAVAFRADLVVIVAEDLDRKAPLTESHKLARALKRALPSVPIALTGSSSLPYFKPAIESDPSIDFAFLGEVDEALPAWLAASPEDRDAVPGLLFRASDGIRSNGVAAPNNLDVLPWPDWEAVHFEGYRQAPHRRRGKLSYVIASSRGCPYRCTFCEELSYFSAVPYRRRTVESVVQEMGEMSARYPGVEFSFTDPVFGLDEPWTLDLCQRLRRELPNAIWCAISRADLISAAAMRAMRAAGCYNILVGLESQNESTLRSVKKFLRKETTRAFFSSARECGMEITASFLIGLPGETKDDVRRTVEYAISLEPDYAQFIVHKHFAGTRPFEGQGTYIEEWEFTPQDMLGPMFVPSSFGSKAELRREQWRAYRKFYLRWSYISRRLKDAVRPGQLERYLQAVPILASMAWNAMRYKIRMNASALPRSESVQSRSMT